MSWSENPEIGCSVKPPIISWSPSPSAVAAWGRPAWGGLPDRGRPVPAPGPSGQVAAAVLPLRFSEVSVGFSRFPAFRPHREVGLTTAALPSPPLRLSLRGGEPRPPRSAPTLTNISPNLPRSKCAASPGPAEGARAARHSSDSSAVTSPGTARLPLPSSGSASAHPGRPRPAPARAPVPPARALVPPPRRAPSRPHSSRRGRAPRAPSASRPPAPPSRPGGGGTAAAGACSVPSHSHGPFLPPLPAARVSCHSGSLALKSSSQLFLPSGRWQGQVAAPRLALLPALPALVLGEPQTLQWPLAVPPLPLEPSSPACWLRPYSPASVRDTLGLRGLSFPPAPCAPARTLAPGSRRNPPSPFASSGAFPSPLLRQPLEPIPWGAGAPPRRWRDRPPFRAGLQGSDRAM